MSRVDKKVLRYTSTFITICVDFAITLCVKFITLCVKFITLCVSITLCVFFITLWVDSYVMRKLLRYAALHTSLQHDHAQGNMDTQTSSIDLHKYCITTETSTVRHLTLPWLGFSAIRLFREPALVIWQRCRTIYIKIGMPNDTCYEILLRIEICYPIGIIISNNPNQCRGRPITLVSSNGSARFANVPLLLVKHVRVGRNVSGQPSVTTVTFEIRCVCIILIY